MFDVFFISFGERLADKHWEIVRERASHSKWIANVIGIRKAHFKAAQQSRTEYFWVVDADSELLPEFKFDLSINRREKASYFFHSRNPVNGLEYGHGGIKLLNKFAVLKSPEDYFDFTTSICETNNIIPAVASINKFNETDFSTWRTAFRESVKLSSKLIQHQNTSETEQRLHTWLTQANGDFADYCIRGAQEGHKFYLENVKSKEKLKSINDFSWLEEKFKECFLLN
jgi:hypothetical protein